MIKTCIEEFENYGKVLSITDGTCTVKVTIDLGPRVIYFARNGKRNMFFCDLKRNTRSDKPEMNAYYGKGRYWYLYGGYRLWLSPESLPETYYPDNDKVNYKIEDDSVTFVPKPQIENGIQTSFELCFCGDGTVLVKNKIENISDKPIYGSAWALCVMNQNSFTYAYQNDADTGLLPNRTVVIWPYTDVYDKRISFNNGAIAVKQDPASDSALKIGFNNTKGKLYTYLDGELFTQTYDTYHENRDYPDGGCSCEIYSCPDFTEAETLSPLTSIDPGECLRFDIKWSIKSADREINSIEDI